jgi:hypothetical protein
MNAELDSCSMDGQRLTANKTECRLNRTKFTAKTIVIFKDTCFLPQLVYRASPFRYSSNMKAVGQIQYTVLPWQYNPTTAEKTTSIAAQAYMYIKLSH